MASMFVVGQARLNMMICKTTKLAMPTRHRDGGIILFFDFTEVMGFWSPLRSGGEIMVKSMIRTIDLNRLPNDGVSLRMVATYLRRF
jgi:hypothetical protein